jgi:hypothetical protein
LTNKIRAFSEFALGNPVTAPLIDAKELLRQTWEVMEIGKESPILEDKEGDGDIPPEMKQRMMQVAEQMEQMGQELQKTQQAAQQAEKKAADETFKRMKAEIGEDKANALLAIEKAKDSAMLAAPGMDPTALTDMVNQAVASALAHMMEQNQAAPVAPPMQEQPPPQEMPPLDPAMQPPAEEMPPTEPPPEGGFSLGEPPVEPQQ